MEELTNEERKKLGLYSHWFMALWGNYFWAKEQIEHRGKTIGLAETPEEKAMRLDYLEWAKTQPWDLEEQNVTNK